MRQIGQKHSHIYNQIGLIAAYLIVSFITISCKNDMEKVKFFERKTLPAQTMQDADIVRTSQGRLQIRLQASIIEQYAEPEHKTIYPKGVDLTIYDASGEKKANIRADYGISYDDRDIMEARNHVVVTDFQTGDTSYLKTITWNSGEHRIYSNDPVKSVNGQRVTYGDGFESDEDFDCPQIIRQRGTIEWQED